MAKLPASFGFSLVRQANVPLAGALLLTLVVMLASWRDGIGHMLGVWYSSPTYVHGFLIAPISAGLIWMGWRKNESLTLWPLAFVGLLLAIAAYGVGARQAIQGLQHLGISLAIISLIAGFCGKTVVERHRFALGFLLFLVPFGAELVPMLQILTAKGMMLVAEIFGVLAIRDGTLIRTEAGDFLVEEGCAGLRFLIASIVTGILVAHLFFRSRRKQIGFVLAAIFIPILANIIRASAVLLIATWSDMKMATGFDHVVYGWGFFFIIMAVLLAGAFLLADPDAPNLPEPAITAPAQKISLLMLLPILLAIMTTGLL